MFRRCFNVVFFVLLTVTFAACASSSEGAGADAEPDSGSNDRSEADAGDENGVQSTETESDIPDVPGAPLNRFDLQIGQCFNEGSWYDEALDRRVDLTATVSCEQAHQSEVYHEAEFPAPNGAPFPGDSAMTEWSTQLCYDAFDDFVAAEYEVSTFEIGFVQPSKETFEHPVGRHRRVFCYVFDVGGDRSVGTAQGSGL